MYNTLVTTTYDKSNVVFLFRCDRVNCQTGFKPGPSGACVDVDECLTKSNACDANEICENTMGSFECINQVSRKILEKQLTPDTVVPKNLSKGIKKVILL